MGDHKIPAAADYVGDVALIMLTGDSGRQKIARSRVMSPAMEGFSDSRRFFASY